MKSAKKSIGRIPFEGMSTAMIYGLGPIPRPKRYRYEG